MSSPIRRHVYFLTIQSSVVYNRIHFLNTFTVQGLGGNPTAIYFSHGKIDAESMQMFAKELPVPVTAFLWKEGDDFRIYYFTGQCEISSCGHATLGASAVTSEIIQSNFCNFLTGTEAKINTRVDGDQVFMRYDTRPISIATTGPALLHSLGLDESSVLEVISAGDTLVIVLHNTNELTGLDPDFRNLKKIISIYVTKIPKEKPDCLPGFGKGRGDISEY